MNSNLTQRRLEPELMDDPSLEGSRHLQALRGLERMNWWSRSTHLLWVSIQALAHATTGPLRVLDLATGAGDVPIRLWRRARRAGVALSIEGCDRSERAIAYARRCAAHTHADVRFFQLDALTDPIPSDYDIIMCSLFLHHLSEIQATQLLKRMAQAARCRVLVNDLIRNRDGLALAYVGTRILSSSAVVHHDGPQSVRAAYTIEEIAALAQRAGLAGAVIARRWPCRFVLSWTRR